MFTSVVQSLGFRESFLLKVVLPGSTKTWLRSCRVLKDVHFCGSELRVQGKLSIKNSIAWLYKDMVKVMQSPEVSLS